VSGTLRLSPHEEVTGSSTDPAPWPARAPPVAAYDVASLAAMLSWRPPDGAEFSVDGGPWRPLPGLTALVVANGPHWGGGYCIAPGACTSSGALEATVISGIGAWGFVRQGEIPRRGTGRAHGNAAQVAASLTTQASPRPAAVHLLKAGKLNGVRGVETMSFRDRLVVRLAAQVQAAPAGPPLASGGGAPDTRQLAQLPPRQHKQQLAAGHSWLPWEVDGDPAGEGAAIVTVLPGAIQLCV
jgi:hypothetical protein